MRERGLARRFARDVEREAERTRDRGLEAAGELGLRHDLRQLTTFTVDPASAEDFDDAISAEPLSAGSVRVWVHIADVSAHVLEGSHLDRAARERGTSVYAPGAVEPMLPSALSSDACSLLPARERLAVTAELELELGSARVARTAFYRSLIRSDARLDYERVDRIFAGHEAADGPWAAALEAAREAASALRRERDRRGALVIDSHEPEFVLDERGEVAEIHPRAQTESHRMIEHLMIAANEAVAALLEKRKIPCLYRVHERPEPERIARLVAQLSALEVPTPPLPERMSHREAAELVGSISQLVDEHVRRTGAGRLALNALVLRSLKQAYYSPRNIGHAGLRSCSYCHFTSPIRRYPDLVCHRALLYALGAAERAPLASELSELGIWTSECEREAMMVERDADDIARCFHLEAALLRNGWEQTFAGEVVGLIPAGAFVAFGPAEEPEPATAAAAPRREDGASEVTALYEGLLPARALSGPGGEREWWELREEETALRGERTGAAVRLGDRVRVQVARVDASRGRVDLLAAQDPGAQG
ncbi:MAG: RNB domain-containing ribonuclease [Actinobacteria bacterium]|nr:MAG: RNB domain-containing ribonuclease [Actinomycetota bacterium]